MAIGHWLLRPLCWVLEHDLSAKDVTETEYRHWTPFCRRCGQTFRPRSELSGDGRCLVHAAKDEP